MNRLAEIAALAALDDHEHARRTLETNHTGIEYLSSALGKMGIETWPTDANFMLAKTGPDVFDPLLRRGIIVRPLAGFGLTDHIRVSIGLPEENERFIKALAELRSGGGPE